MLEDEAKKFANTPAYIPADAAIQFSIAISLKRIADAMTEPNEYGEAGSRAIYGAISRALAQHG